MSLALSLASFFMAPSAQAATDYYPSYTLSPSTTDYNLNFALWAIIIGLTILVVNSLWALAAYAWRYRASHRAQRQTWSHDRS